MDWITFSCKKLDEKWESDGSQTQKYESIIFILSSFQDSPAFKQLYHSKAWDEKFSSLTDGLSISSNEVP